MGWQWSCDRIPLLPLQFWNVYSELMRYYVASSILKCLFWINEILCGISCADMRVATYIQSKTYRKWVWNAPKRVWSRIEKYRNESFKYPWPNPLVKRADTPAGISDTNHTWIRIEYIFNMGCDGFRSNLGYLVYSKYSDLYRSPAIYQIIIYQWLVHWDLIFQCRPCSIIYFVMW
jgi:hypothetical protein